MDRANNGSLAYALSLGLKATSTPAEGTEEVTHHDGCEAKDDDSGIDVRDLVQTIEPHSVVKPDGMQRAPEAVCQVEP